MPTRRKNVDLNRIKRSAKRGKLGEYLSSSYVQYLFIFLIWGALLLINQSTEMRFEYFWPGWLFICSIHDSMKYQGLQYTVVFIIIVITVDLICFFLFPASLIYSCGSAYVWVYLLWHTDQGLCFLTLTFCFVFVYFELGFYSREAKLSHSIYLFRPFAAHSIGYPVVCMGFSIKRYLDIRHRKFKKMDVRRQNCLYFRILRDALPLSAITNGSGAAYTSIYLPDDIPDLTEANDDSYNSDTTSNPLPWSVFLLQQLSKSFCTRLCQWTSLHPALLDRECSSTSHSLNNGAGPVTSTVVDGAGPKRISNGGQDSNTLTSTSTSRRHPTEGINSSEAQTKGKQVTANKSGGSRYPREDLSTRLENNVRRLRTEVQSMRAVESQLRNQLTHLEREDRLNRLCLSDQREKHEALVTELAKLSAQCRTERSNLASMEQSLADEKRLRQSLEEQLVEDTKEDLRSSPPGSPSVSEHSQPTRPGIQAAALDDSRTRVGGPPAEVLEASCCQHRHTLESEVYTQRVALRQLDEQLRVLSSSRNRQNHTVGRGRSMQLNVKHTITMNAVEEQRSRPSTSSSTEDPIDQQTLLHWLQTAKAEAERLANKLRQQNWMKQELLTSYHNSVREINELSKTHKQRDLQILELTMKAEQLECLYAPRNTGERNRPGRVKRDSAQLGSFGEKSLSKMSLTFPASVCSISHSNPSSQISSESTIWGLDDALSSGYLVSTHSPLERNPPIFSQPLHTSSTDPSYSSSLHPDKHTDQYDVATSGLGCPQSFFSPTVVSSELTGQMGLDPCTSSTHFTDATGCADFIMTKHARSNGLGNMQRLPTESH
ncbi:Macoilin [Clonorchis sinensis]|uniref:Macoilin n=1 Tax=Clonorchis sinensis TaxID=79923 RepID=A0A8T1M4U5_CLOSI|nr:Macoilin [Clonorchis sinensis]